MTGCNNLSACCSNQFCVYIMLPKYGITECTVCVYALKLSKHAKTESNLLFLCLEMFSSRKFLRLSGWRDSVLGFGNVVGTSDLCLATCDVAFLPAGEGVLPSSATISRVVNYHHGGIHSCQRVHAALASWV